MSTELAVQSQALPAEAPGFNSQSGWELANRIGKAFAASTLVPQTYQGNVANCIVALEMANRMQASPLMVMQNLYIVHGNPGWSSKFLIACFNQCGRFSALRYEWNEARTACRAWAIEKATGDRIDGPLVTVEMAKAEGWSSKNGSKWKTMPELMLMYRAAAFLIRTYAPEISMGLSTDDELHDVVDMDTGEISQQTRAGKPAVRTPVALAQTPGVDGDEAQDTSSEGAKPEAGTDQAAQQPQQEQEQPAAQQQAQDVQEKPAKSASAAGALATEGEKKLILNRVKNNNLNLRELLQQADLAELPDDLTGLTKDCFVVLKDLLPKAA